MNPVTNHSTTRNRCHENGVCNGMKRHGFTIVELILVIVIICILSVLAVVNLKDSMPRGRDTERRTDIDTIAAHLETYYESGDPTDTTVVGEYPSTTKAVVSNIHQILPDVDDKTISAPNITDPTTSFISAIDNSIQSPTIDQYVYQPLQAGGSLCTDNLTQECVRFNLFYRLETDGIVYTKVSKNQ